MQELFLNNNINGYCRKCEARIVKKFSETMNKDFMLKIQKG